MAHVPLVVKHAVSEFFSQWYAGLCPSLTLKTCQSGKVLVTSRVFMSMIHNQPSFYNSEMHCNLRRRHKQSGRGSRRRRHKRRKEARESTATSSVENTGDSELDSGVVADLCPRENPLQWSEESASQSRLVSTAVQAVCRSFDVACETVPDLPLNDKPVLSVAKCTPISIPPRQIYHPAIINACQAICDKHPSQVTKDEADKFNFYLEQKRKMGQPVESDLIYLPTSMRNCLHCGHLT